MDGAPSQPSQAPAAPVSEQGAPDPAQVHAPAKAGFVARYKQLLAEYGPVALGVYLTIFFSVWGGAAAAISLGLDLQGLTRWLGMESGASLGAVGLGYVVAKATQVLRILATLALTPLVARWLGREPAPAEAPVDAPVDTQG